jgi:beta-alanine degradation protein BauB
MSKVCSGLKSLRFAAIVAVALYSRIALAQDPVKVAPDNYKVALDNDNVRVCNVTVKPGGKVATHSHPDHVVYAINGGKLKFTYPDGKTKDVEIKTGEAMFIKAETHQGENTGTGDLKLVIFELKKPAGSAAKAPAGDDQMKAAPDMSKVVLENDRVRLIEAKMKAGGKMAKHTHPAYVTYALKDAKAKLSVGDKTDEKTMTAGQAMWGEPTTHAVENVGAETQTLVLEIK